MDYNASTLMLQIRAGLTLGHHSSHKQTEIEGAQDLRLSHLLEPDRNQLNHKSSRNLALTKGFGILSQQAGCVQNYLAFTSDEVCYTIYSDQQVW
jgi:hypothetical protein